MNSELTEITETRESQPTAGWIFYDSDCRSCSKLALHLGALLRRRGFVFAPLQQPWAQRELRLSPAEALAEMRVLLRDGRVFGGADAIIFLARQVWWMSPLSRFAKLPGARALLHSLYRWVAAHRHCAVGHREPSGHLKR